MTSSSLASLLSARLSTERPNSSASTSVWRFLSSPAPVSLGEGNTPLLRISTAPSVLLKDEGRNPGASTLDRVASVIVTTAKTAGHKQIAYTGESNALASALAVYAAHAGLPCTISLSDRASDLEHLRAAAAGATLHQPGQQANPEGLLSPEDIALATRLAAHTVASEIAEQMQWKLPETLLIPGATPADLLHFEQSFAFLLDHNWTASAHAPQCRAVHIAPPPHAPSRIAAQALQQLSDQVILLEEDRVRESLKRMARYGWMLSPGAAAGMAVAETLPANAAPIVLIETRSALSAAREVAQLLNIRRYPTRMPVGGIISPQ